MINKPWSLRAVKTMVRIGDEEAKRRGSRKAKRRRSKKPKHRRSKRCRSKRRHSSGLSAAANGFVDGWLWRRRRFLATVLHFVDDLQRFSSSVRDEWLRLQRRFATVCDGFGDCLRRLSVTVCDGFDIGDDSCLSVTLPLHRRR
nr:hypothetical protein CFP56_79565 [Quercus suber]